MASPLTTAPLRVLLLTQWFEPEPTFKGLSFARELRAQGFDVRVVTGFPNYPGGNLYPGYRVRLVQREVIDGIAITRLPLYPSHDRSAKGRVLNYVSFAVSAGLYCAFTWQRPQVIYAYQPPLTVAVSAAVAGLLRRVPVVVDIQDMWPDTLRATGMIRSERVLGVVGAVCQWVYRRAARIAVLSEGFKGLLLARGVPASKVEVIPNWCDEGALAAGGNARPTGFPGLEHFTVLFAGNMGKAQALDSVLAAASQVAAQAPQVRFVFLGGGIEVDNLRSAAQQAGQTNVVFLPAVPMNEVGAALRAADALLVHLRRDPLFSITIPSKTQAYMAVGKPLIMAVDGDAAALVQQAQCGVVVPSEDAAALAAAVLQLAALPAEARTRLGENGARFYASNLSLQAGTARFGALFRAATAA
jgi:colanic acid biosynthesis glycosyl transferase WcaI